MRTCDSAIFLTLSILIGHLLAIPIDNGVEGEPEIECGASAITVNFNTRNNFEGHVYVKGRFAEQGCRSDESGRKIAAITLPFTACGVQRTRSLNPRGIFVSTTVVITFHPQFLTKVDRAYTLQCFYMEADKTVSQELEVSEITTLFHSQAVPMPVCRYDILDGSPTGQPIKYALIGQQVYHKWTCTTETTDIFCMVVHDCFVDDGAGNKAILLNENGCALDRFLLQNLEYTSDLMAGREAHVFKYADKAALFFQCQITITIKEPGQQCPRPQCPAPGGIGGAIIEGGAGVTGASRISAGAQPTAAPARPPPAGTGGPNPAPTAGIGVEAPTRRPKGHPTPGGNGLPEQPYVSQAPGGGGTQPPQAPQVTGNSYIGTNAPPPQPNQVPTDVPITGAPPPPPSQVPIDVPYTGAPSAAPYVAPATGGPPLPQVPINVVEGTRPPLPINPPPTAGQPYATGAPVTGPPQQPAATGPPPSAQPNQYGTNAPSIPSAVPPPQPSTGAPPPPVAYTQAPVAPTQVQPTQGPQPTPSVIGGYAGDLPLPLDFELRRKREARFGDEIGTWDLRAPPIVTFDIDDDSSLVQDLKSRNQQLLLTSAQQPSLAIDTQGQLYCLTSVSLGLFLSFLVASTLTAAAFCFLFCMRKSSFHSKQ